MKNVPIRAFNDASLTGRMDIPSTDPEKFDPLHSLEDYITVIPGLIVPYRPIYPADETSSHDRGRILAPLPKETVGVKPAIFFLSTSSDNRVHTEHGAIGFVRELRHDRGAGTNPDTFKNHRPCLPREASPVGFVI